MLFFTIRRILSGKNIQLQSLNLKNIYRGYDKIIKTTIERVSL